MQFFHSIIQLKFKKMELNRLNVVELDAKELINCDGGNWLKGTLWGSLVYELAMNWDAVKAGFSDGWNGTYNNKF